MVGYIYVITNKLTGKQYIGQTIRTIKERFSQHKSSARNNTDGTYLHKAMNKYGIDNFNVKEIISIEYENSKDFLNKLNELEKYYIAKYNTLSPNGYNLTKGGKEGCEYHKVKIDEYDIYGNYIATYESIKDASVKIGNISCSNSIIKCCTGKSLFAYQRIWRYHGEPLNKFPMPDTVKANRNNKLAPIDQYSKKGEFIKSFNSAIEAANSVNSDNSSHILECCNGKLYTAFKYVWRYKGDSFDKYDSKEKRFVPCKQLDIDGNLIQIFSSIQEACGYLGRESKNTASNIVACCKGKRKTAYGYKWIYA